MPLDDRGRLHQHHHFEPTWPHPVKPYPQEPIDGVESETAGAVATQDCQLVAEHNDFELQLHAAAKPTSEPGEDRRDVCKHAGDTTVPQDR
jgi:hypothetical protein